MLFVVGYVLCLWIGVWVMCNKGLLMIVDCGLILLVVYIVFGVVVVEGLWSWLLIGDLVLVGLLCVVLLVFVLVLMFVIVWLMKLLCEDVIVL